MSSNLCHLIWHQRLLSLPSDNSRSGIKGEKVWCFYTPCQRFVWAPSFTLCFPDYSFGTSLIQLKSFLVSFQASLRTVWSPVSLFVTAAHHQCKIWLVFLWQHNAEKNGFLIEKFSPFSPWGSNLIFHVISKAIELERCGLRHLIGNSMNFPSVTDFPMFASFFW